MLYVYLKSEITTDSDERIYLKFSAKKARKEIIEIIKKLEEDEDFQIRSDIKWIYATLSHCYFAVDEMEQHKLFSAKFHDLNPLEWEIKTYEESLAHLNSIKNLK